MKILKIKELQSISGGEYSLTRSTNWEDVLLRDTTQSTRATDWENTLLRDSTLD